MGLRVVDPAPASEADLIAACVRGERDAERELFRREYRRVHALLFRMLGTTRELEDLAQEVFIGVFQALPRFRGDAKLRTWIDRIAVHTALDHMKARKRVPVPVDTVFDRPDQSGHVDERAHAREGLRRLYAALGAMKPEARIAFALYAIDGRTIAEVAAITGVTALTAKVRIWRARRELEGRLADDPILASYIATHRRDA